MTCRQFPLHLADLTAEQLALRLNDEAEEHLADCPTCRDFRRTYQQTLALARRLPEDSPPKGMLARFLRAAAEDVERTPIGC